LRRASPDRRACPPGGSLACRTWDRSSWSPSSRGSDLDVLATVPERLRHPEELVQELVHAGEERLVEKLAGAVEPRSHGGEVHVPEDGDEPELPEHRDEVLDHSRPAEHACRDA